MYPLIPLEGSRLHVEAHPKILGVTLDTHLHFHKHVKTTEEKAKKKLSILKALTGTSWGQQKEAVLATY